MIFLYEREQLVLSDRPYGEHQLCFLGSQATVCLREPLPSQLKTDDPLVVQLSKLHGPVTRMLSEDEGEGLVFHVDTEVGPRVFTDLAAAATVADEHGVVINVCVLEAS